MEKGSKIFVAGSSGMVGSAIVKSLNAKGYSNLLLKSSKELNLINQAEVNSFFDLEKPEYVFLAAAKVGGIQANNIYKADFLYNNLMIEANVIHASYLFSVKKLLFLGSSCVYPQMAPQPIKEEYLLSGSLEPTNEPYAIAKIAGLKMCDAYRFQHDCNFVSVMPTNLYGPRDNYDLQNSHVLPAFIRKFHEAKNNKSQTVEIWGSGSPLREFMYAEDMADACVFIMENYNEKSPINIGTGQEVSIKELALLVKKVVGYDGELIFDPSKPDGTPRKLLDISKLTRMGFRSKIGLEDGISKAYKDFLASLN